MERKKPEFERTKEYKIAEKTVEILDKKYPCEVHEVYKWLDPLNVIEIVRIYKKIEKQQERNNRRAAENMLLKCR